MAETVQLQAGSAEAVVDLADGGRLSSLRVAGHELLGGAGSAVVEHGSFVMAPWAGRIRDGQLHHDGATYALPTDRTHPHAGHGLVMDRPWQLEDCGPDRVRLRCALDQRWPFGGAVEQEIVLRPDGIDQRVQVHAETQAFPATIGWHPWFLRELVPGSGAALDFTADGMLRRDAAGIPDGTVVPVPDGPWDDCFTGVTWPMVITWPDVLELRIDSDAHFAVIYNERRSAFCVEPQDGPPDGPNTEPQYARPGQPLAASTSWSWRILGAAG